MIFRSSLSRFATSPASAVSLVVLLGVHLPLHAQTAADRAEAARQADILQRQNQQRLQRDIESAIPQERAPSGIDTRELLPRVDASAAGTQCHDIRIVSITSAPNLSADVREQITRNFTGRCLGVVEIEQILAEITRDYISRGFVTTRAYLPQQDLSSGKLEILVMEGVIEKITLEDGGKGSIHMGNVFPSESALFNLRDFEQGIDQVNRLSSNNATLDIQPGKEAGASRILIKNAPRTPFHGSISADNQGSDSTGRHQLGVTAISDRLLGFNELLLFTHRRSVPFDKERKFSESNSFSATMPFGYSTVSLSLNRSQYTSTIAAPSGLDLQFKGDSATDSIKLDHVVVRDQQSRITVSGTLTAKESKSYLAGQFLAVSSRPLTVLDLDTSITTGLAGGVFGVDIGYARGLRIAGALQDPDNLPDLAPRAQFEKLKIGFSYNIPFQINGADFAFSTQLTAQTAPNTLYGSEQILIGGMYSVRGFVKNTLSGDSGYYARNELSMRSNLLLGNERVSMRYFAGVDFGHVSNRVPNVPSGRLAGMAIGVNANWRGASFELINTRPLDKPAFFNRESPQTWIRLNYAT